MSSEHSPCVIPAGLLKELIGAVAVLAGKDKTRPILACIHLQAGDGRLRVSATDATMALVATADVPDLVGSIDAILRPGDLLPHLYAPAMPAELRLVAGEGGAYESLRLTCGCVQATRSVVVGDNFPALTEPQADRHLVCEPLDLDACLAVASSRADKERGSSMALSGVHIHADEDGPTVEATDGKHLARLPLPVLVTAGDPVDMLLPLPAVAQLRRQLGHHCTSVELGHGASGQVTWTTDHQAGEHRYSVTATARGIVASYPCLRTMLDQMAAIEPSILSLPVSDLRMACQQVSAAAASSGSDSIVLSWEPDAETIHARTLASVLGRVDVDLPVVARTPRHGTQREIGLRTAYLLALLADITGPTLHLELRGPGKACLVHDGDRTYLIMPITLPKE